MKEPIYQVIEQDVFLVPLVVNLVKAILVMSVWIVSSLIKDLALLIAHLELSMLVLNVVNVLISVDLVHLLLVVKLVFLENSYLLDLVAPNVHLEHLA